MEAIISRADLHVHSKYSDKPSEWILRRIGCPESFTDPHFLYRTARERGMDFVTITDHNAIGGVLEIAHLPGVFLSEEVTAYFPEDRVGVHVVVLGITEAQHAEIQRLRRHIYDLTAYLRREGIVHFLAHPLYNVNPAFSLEHVEKLLLLFEVFEVCNGGKGRNYNALARSLVERLTPELLDRLANKHGLEPAGEEPWRKGFVGGSDDHGGLFIAGTCTAVQGGATVERFLQGVAARQGRPEGRDGGSLTLAHNMYSVAYRFYRDRLLPKGSASRDLLTLALDRLFSEMSRTRPITVAQRLQIAVERYLPRRRRPAGESRLFDLVRQEARRLLSRDGELRTALFESQGKPDDLNRAIFRFASHLSDALLFHYANAVLTHLARAQVLEAFEVLSAIGSLHLLLAPYLFSFQHQNKDRAFLAAVRTYCGNEEEAFAVAYFTEGQTWSEARRLHFEQLCAEARSREDGLTVLTCASDGKAFHEGVKTFPTVGVFQLRELPDLPLYFPPLLDLLDYCDRHGFNLIHTDTPGPMGLAALLIGRLLHCPVMMQHDAPLIDSLSATCPPEVLPLFWRYLRWVYEAMDLVLVTEPSARDRLVEQGVSADKVRIVEPVGWSASEALRPGWCQVYGEVHAGSLAARG
jgi:hypothetical protein